VNTELPESSRPPAREDHRRLWGRVESSRHRAILAMHTETSVFENHTSGGKGVGKDAYSPNPYRSLCRIPGPSLRSAPYLCA
jgi:hypothetical protein